jgi:hypothetical protein
MILPDHLRQGDSGSLETPQHCPMILEDFLMLRLPGPSDQFLCNSAMEFPVNAGSMNSGSFRR